MADLLSSPWVWGVAGLALLLGELLLAGFYLTVLGLGCLVTAVQAWAFPATTPPWNWLVPSGMFIVSSVAFLFTIRPFLTRLMYEGGGEFNTAALVDKTALVIEDIGPSGTTGQVRVDQETWAATSRDGERIGKGTVVRVISVHGNRVVVRPANN